MDKKIILAREVLSLISVGDVVVRFLGGVIPMELTVTDVTDDKIICGSWEFDRKTGIEIDKDISVPVSFIIPRT